MVIECHGRRTYFMDEMKCPKCDAPCERDGVDIGVGTQYGPWYCTECDWLEGQDKDLGPDPDPVIDDW